jgi:NAD+ diphosphatase
VALSVRAHNREALHRTDEEWLAEQWAAPSSKVLVMVDGRMRPELTWVAPADAPPGERVLLGHRDGVTRFLVLASADDVPDDTDGWVGLRGHFGLLNAHPDVAADLAPWLFHAVGMAQWRRATRYCPRCTGRLELRSAGHELVCLDCGRSQYPRTDPAVIMSVAHGEPGSAEERVLLGRQAAWPPSQWSTLAGFCEPGETLEDAVRREVFEETGVHVGEVTYVGSQPWPLPASLMVGFAARATSTELQVHEAEIEDARWFTRAELRAGLEDGTITVPRSVSISSSLLLAWFGDELPGQDAWRPRP